MSTCRLCIRLLLLIILLTSCSPAPSSPSPRPHPPTRTAAPTAENHSGLLEAGRRYSDPSGDMAISFLDVVAFQATVNEESETLEVILQMRDIPPTALRGQAKNVFEYFWLVFVYLDASKTYPADIPGDYYFALNTNMLDPALGIEGIRTPIPGTPVTVPINQLFENKNVYRSSTGVSISGLNAVADPDADTITWTGRVPDIKSNARFSFDMTYYDGTKDRPDNFTSSELESLSTPVPQTTQALPTVSSPLANADNNLQLQATGRVRAYPGPEHYAGDVLTFEITNDGSFGDGTINISMSLDNQKPTKVSATSSWTGLLLPEALNTTNLSGRHTLQFRTADGQLNETYSFNVLPADQRPTNEMHASWLDRETDCCIFHYISETAAARDIDFISEHFQQGAEEFSTIMGSKIDPKLNIYIIDRLWGNGGFGGGGELLISYTDRYYGPTIDGEGLEVLARHEFTHAADIDLAAKGDGINFDYEGLAVYIAGGHYKHEPLAERGAALYDLGYYVPVGEFLNQHELAYLYPAAMLTYITEIYGTEKMWKFLGADDNPQDGQLGSLEAAIQSTFGITLKDFDQGFQAWLEGHEPGEQLVDLRLTIELQDLRREYQDTYSPSPKFLLAEVPDAVARPEYLSTVMREAHAPANIAVELIIANGQRALLDGDYPRVEALDKTLAEVLSTGKFEDPLAKDYLDIVLAASSKGYEIVNLDIQGDQASARVTAEPPILEELTLQKINGIWQVLP